MIRVLLFVMFLSGCMSEHAPTVVQAQPITLKCSAKCDISIPMPGSKASVARETNGFDALISLGNNLVNVADEGLLGYAIYSVKEVAKAIKSNSSSVTTNTTTNTTDDHAQVTTTTTADSNNSSVVETSTVETNTTTNETETNTSTITDIDTTTETNTNTEYDNDTNTNTTTYPTL